MRYLFIIALLFSMNPAFAWLEKSTTWKDCNLPQNKAQCDAEYAQYRADYAAMQAQYSGQELNRKVCETFNVCGTGSGPGGAGGGH